MSLLNVDRISPATGSIVNLSASYGATVTGSLDVSGNVNIAGNLNVTGTFDAHVLDFKVNADSMVFGDHANDTITFSGSAVAIPNNLNFDSNTLFLDANNNRVGILTTSPNQALEVFGNIRLGNGGGGAHLLYNATNLYFNNVANGIEAAIVNGKFGINVDDPDEILEVAGNVKVSGANKLYLFDSGGEHLSSDGTDLTIASGQDINLTATTDINIPANVGLTFGDDGEKIEGDGTDLTISAGAAINIAAGTLDLSAQTVDVTLNAAADALNFDSNTLSIDASNNRVGIGTAAPSAQLDVHDTTTSSANTGGKLRLSANDSAAMGDSHRLGVLEFSGAEDTSNTQVVGARIEALTDGAWTNVNNPCALYFYVNKGDNTAPLALKLDNNQKATFSADAVIGDDLSLKSDSAVLNFGADDDVSLTHVADTGLLLNSTMKIQFNDASQFIHGSDANTLSLGATAEIDLTATSIDINGEVDVSSNLTVGGTLTLDSVGVTAIQSSGESFADNDTSLMTSAAIDDRINTAITAEDLDLTTDSGTIDIDLNSETLTIAGGTGIDTSATGTTATVTLDLTEVMANSGTANLVLTSDGDGTLTGETSLVFDSATLSIGASGTAGTVSAVTAAADAAGNSLTIQGGSALAGNTANTGVGGNVLIQGGAGKGTANGGSIVFKSATAGGSASTLNSIDDTILTLSSDLLATFTGRIITDDATEATSTTDGSIQTDGGLSVAKSAVIGDDLDLLSNGAILSVGSSSKFILTDQNSNNTLMATSGHRLAFGNAGEYISGDGTDLDIISSGDLDITATLVDVTGALTTSGILKTDDATDATSTTDGSLQTDGGLSVAKDMVGGNDLLLLSDAAVIKFGASSDILLTHDTDRGLILEQATDATTEPVLTIKTVGDLASGGGIEFISDNGAGEGDDDILGYLSFKGDDSGNAETQFAKLEVLSSDVTDGDEGGKFVFSAMAGGTAGTAAMTEILSMGGEDQANSSPCEVVINEGGTSIVDFRVESNQMTNMLFVDASDDKVGIGTQTAGNLAALLHIENSAASQTNPMVLLRNSNADANGPILRFENSAAADGSDDDVCGTIQFFAEDDGTPTDAKYATIEVKAADVSDSSEDGLMSFKVMVAGTTDVDALSIGAETVFNEGSVARDFRVESNGQTHMLYVDGTNDRIGIGVSDPDKPVEIMSTTADQLKISYDGSNYVTLGATSGGAGRLFAKGGTAPVYTAALSYQRHLLDAQGNTETMQADTDGSGGIVLQPAGGTADALINLPALGTSSEEAAPGWTVTFVCTTPADEFILHPATGDKIGGSVVDVATGNVVTAGNSGAGTVNHVLKLDSGSQAGDRVTLMAVDSDSWIILDGLGSWVFAAS